MDFDEYADAHDLHPSRNFSNWLESLPPSPKGETVADQLWSAHQRGYTNPQLLQYLNEVHGGKWGETALRRWLREHA